MEVPSLVGRSGPVPLTMGPLPGPVRGLTQAIHAYERLASEAAVTGDRRTALQALMAHPFVRSKHTAEKILDEASPPTAIISPVPLNGARRRPVLQGVGGTDCGVYRIGLGVYAIGRLVSAEADALSAHLNGCPPCRAELAELRTVAELLAHSVRAPGPARKGVGRGPRTGASRLGLSGACAYGARGPGRSR